MHRHLADLIRPLAEREPERWLYTFLHADRGDQAITAGQLHHDAALIAAYLNDCDVRRGDIVALVFDHGYELLAAFWGAIYLGAVPTIMPYLARGIRSQAYVEQLRRLAGFVGIETVVTVDELRVTLDHQLADVGCRVLTLPASVFDAAAPYNDRWPIDEPSGPPYIQFSSGTTGSPKGVLLSHAAVLHYCRVSAAHFAATSDDVTVDWLPLYHDMGLVNSVLEPLVTPHSSVLISPAEWLREPHRLLKAIDAFRGSITWMPNFGLRYCTRRIRAEQIAGVDLSSWRVVGNASEPVLLDDLRAFAERFAAYGLNGNALTISYGLAEHVAGLTWTAHDRAPAVDWVDGAALETGAARPTVPDAAGSRPIISCGEPLESVELRVVDDDGRPVPERVVGEVLAKSPMVCAGYYRMPEASAAAVVDGWLHTGDLGYLADGELYVCGRKKDLIIVAGRNIHPHHLEATAVQVLGEQGRVAAAFAIANERLGTEMPIVVCEAAARPDDSACVALQHAIREAIAEAAQVFVGDVLIVDRGWVVRTTSGKVNRAATRAKYLAERASRATHAAPIALVSERASDVVATERRLVEIWETVFGQSGIAPQDDFFALGGDSLLAVELVMTIEQVFRCSLDPTALLEAPTAAALARLIHPANPTTDSSSMVIGLQPICGPTERPPFFCVHGLGGGVLDYRPLAQALGSAQPFYGVRASEATGEGAPQRVEDMAADYVRAIKAVQPAGPYHLGGYCFGGVVAFEMARQLTAAGEQVALLAIVEGYAPNAGAGQNAIVREWRLAIEFIRSLPYWLRDYVALGRIQRRARNRRLTRLLKKRVLRLAGFAIEIDADDLIDGNSSKPARAQRRFEAHVAAGRRYVPSPYTGPLVLFRTSQRLFEAPSHDMGWGKLSTQPIAVEMLPGSHSSILEQPHVGVLAAKLARFLDSPIHHP